MPLREGSSDEAFRANVAELIDAGKPRDQALAIAYSKQRGEGGKGDRSARCAMIRSALGQEGFAGGWPDTPDEPPDGVERAVFSVPISRWANAEGAGLDDALGRAARAGRGLGRPAPENASTEALEGEEGDDAVRVPNVQQGTAYTCGPAALRGALQAFGVGADEDELAAAAGTTADGGTSAEGLVAAAETVGVDAEVKSGLSVRDVESLIEEGSVVIACVQAPRSDGDGDASHWVVVTAVRDEFVELMDPTVPDAATVVPVDEFESDWRGYDEGGMQHGLAVVLTGDVDPATATIAQPRAAY